MRVSFLVQGNELLSKLESIEITDEIQRESTLLPGTDDFYIVELSKAGDSIEAAKDLAELRDNALSAGDCKLLDDEPSERFERDLFRQIALFERALRKLITLALCPKEGSLDVDLVSKLDKQSFGELFDALFVDIDFNNAVKSFVAKGSCKLEKRQILSKVTSMKENSVWSQTFSEGEMPIIEEQHRVIQDFRNDVMHAHRMDEKQYRNALSVIKGANRELDSAVALRVEGDFSRNIRLSSEALSQVLSKMLDVINPAIQQITSNMVAQIDTGALAQSLLPLCQSRDNNPGNGMVGPDAREAALTNAEPHSI